MDNDIITKFFLWSKNNWNIVSLKFSIKLTLKIGNCVYTVFIEGGWKLKKLVLTKYKIGTILLPLNSIKMETTQKLHNCFSFEFIQIKCRKLT